SSNGSDILIGCEINIGNLEQREQIHLRRRNLYFIYRRATEYQRWSKVELSVSYMQGDSQRRNHVFRQAGHVDTQASRERRTDSGAMPLTRQSSASEPILNPLAPNSACFY